MRPPEDAPPSPAPGDDAPDDLPDPFGGVFAERLVRWQRSHGRSELPWQNTRDPYRVWLSEVMLQQTQVSTVRDYYARFLVRFPDVAALAAASEDEVLGLWSGLGYYSRARNLHRCAQAVVQRFGGRFPGTAEALETLPGIGRSTAAAIAAFCFDERVSILDGNVKRVLARLLAFGEDLALLPAQRALWREADRLLPGPDRAADMPAYTQGLMDLGAGICAVRRPQCLICPVEALCRGRASGDPARLPVRSRRLKRSEASLWLLLACGPHGSVWLERRPSTGIWAGLHAPPMFDSREAVEAAIAAAGAGGAEPVFWPARTHVLTHKDLLLHPVEWRLPNAHPVAAQGGWFAADRWRALGLPAPVRRLLEALAA